jgi:hypothetical protein
MRSQVPFFDNGQLLLPDGQYAIWQECTIAEQLGRRMAT